MKLSLFLFVLRLYGFIHSVRYMLYIGMVFVSLFYISSTALFVTLCTPRTTEIPVEVAQTAQCRRTGYLENVQGVVDIITDFYLLAIPIPLILKLQLRPRLKIGVLIVFGTGVL